MKKLLLTCAAALMAVGAWAEILTPTSIESTMIQAGTNAGTAMYGTTPLLCSMSKISGGKLTDQLLAYGGTPLTIVKVDYSNLPDGATVLSAALKFHSACTVSGKNSQLAVAEIGTDWSASTATWNNTDLTATFVANLAYSATAGVDQQCDIKNLVVDDADQVLAFAIYTNTGREQAITNISVDIEYTISAVEEFTYTVNAVDASSNVLQTIASGTCFESDNLTVYAPYAINKDGVWYVMTNTENYGTAITATNTYNIVYAANNNMVAFAEGESNTRSTSGNYSGGFVGYVAAQNYTNRGIAMGTLQPGVYRMTANITANPTREVWLRDNSFATTAEVDNMICRLGSNGIKSVDFTIYANTTVLVNGKNSGTKSNQSADFDYVYIERIGDITEVPVTISAAGWATYVAPLALDFTDNAIEAYAVSAVSATSVTLTQLTTVPAGEAIIVKGATGNVPVAASAAPITNLLDAATAPVTATGSEYVLAKQEGNVVFAPVAEGVVIPAGKAYLKSLSGAASLRIDIEGMEDGYQTAISLTPSLTEGEGACYDLYGRKSNGKGLMIQNGKVVLVK